LATFEMEQLVDEIEMHIVNRHIVNRNINNSTLLCHCCDLKININKYKFLGVYVTITVIAIIICCLTCFTAIGTNNMYMYCDNKTIQCDYYKTLGIINNTEIFGDNIMHSYIYNNNNICYEYLHNIGNNNNNNNNDKINKTIDLFILKKNNYDCITNYKLYNPNKIYIIPVISSLYTLCCIQILYLSYLKYINNIFHT